MWKIRRLDILDAFCKGVQRVESDDDDSLFPVVATRNRYPGIKPTSKTPSTSASFGQPTKTIMLILQRHDLYPKKRKLS